MNESRKHLLHTQREKIEAEYNAAIRSGMARPVVFVLDIRNNLAKTIVMAYTSETDVADRIDSSHRQGIDPIAIICCPRTEAIYNLSPIAQSTATRLSEEPPTTQFDVILIDEGGLSALRIDEPPLD